MVDIAPRRIGLVGIATFAVVILTVGGVLLALRGSTADPDDAAGPTTTSSTTTTSPATTTAAVATTTAAGPTAEGFGAIDAALSAARALWDKSDIQSYGYQINVECDCPEASTTWVRRFAEWDSRETPMEDLFARLTTALDDKPDSMTVSFSESDGHLVSFEVVTGENTRSVAIAHFHPIVAESSPYDGEWRLVSGVLDGDQFATVTTGGYPISLDGGRIAFPIDCNDAQGPVDITGEWFGIGPYITTAVGCGEPSPTSKAFNEALPLSDTIRLAGDQLVLSSDRSELRFVTPEAPKAVADLPLTSAGTTLTLSPRTDTPTAASTSSSRRSIASARSLGTY